MEQLRKRVARLPITSYGLMLADVSEFSIEQLIQGLDTMDNDSPDFFSLDALKLQSANDKR